ncbi:MAG: tRNA (N(6)-L-threonylcarbamoyladenosine(37)-C(2))-methylthiotransferase MtaB [Thiohalocapsa sp.]
MSSVSIITFGCRLNAYESEVIAAAADAAGLADAVIVNTCAVTAEAERQARQAIRRAHRERPTSRIIVTGCAATLAAERYRGLPGVDLVLDNRAKLQPESYATARASLRDLADPAPFNPHPAPAPLVGEGTVGAGWHKPDKRLRAYLQVQQGCDHRCTFCIIPYARGPSRSKAPATVIAEARRLVEEGCHEIVLTGVDLTAYGEDLPQDIGLGQLAASLLEAVPELPRLRLSSLDPSEIDERLWRLIGDEPRLMPHLHLSLQAGDDLILKRMKRRHSRAQAVAAARRAHSLRPEMAIGADLIAGFPTESEAMFRHSLDLVEECGIAFLHVFPYSERPGTPAARMPQVDPAVVRERAARLRQAGAAALEADLARRVGCVGDVLVEQPGRGRAACYAGVRFAAPVAAGPLCHMRFVAADERNLIGVPA